MQWKKCKSRRIETPIRELIQNNSHLARRNTEFRPWYLSFFPLQSQYRKVKTAGIDHLREGRAHRQHQIGSADGHSLCVE
jgi:hypothetical protein